MNKLLCCQGGLPGAGCRNQDNCTGPIDSDDPFRTDLQQKGIDEILEIGSKYLNGGTDMHDEQKWD